MLQNFIEFCFENVWISSFISLVCVIGTLHAIPRLRNVGYKLPPGPWGLPLLGYFPFLGKDPHLDLEKLREKYGNVMGMYVGSRYLVVLSDFNSIRKTFNQQEFLGRPDKFFSVSSEFGNLADMNGQEWHDQRKITINSLKAIYGPGYQNIEEIIKDEIVHLLARVEKHVNEPRMNMRQVITPSVNNIIFKVISGSWFPDDDFNMKNLSLFEDLTARIFTNISILYFFPWLSPIYSKFSSLIRECSACAKLMEQFIRKEIEEHDKNLDEDHPRDYLDHYLLEMRKGNYPEKATKDVMTENCVFLLAAGSDTVRNTLEWSMIIMAKYPEVQEKVHKEIVSNFGTQYSPSWSERSKIPYTEAVIMEIMRWRSLTVLNCMRKVTEDTTLNGYDIPKGTYLINSIWACHMNPEEWEEPTKFYPERFLSQDGSRAIQKENLIPFSFGRRNCPGDKMAKVEVYMFFTAMMQKFKVIPPEGGLSMETYVKINAQSAQPFVKVLNRDF